MRLARSPPGGFSLDLDRLAQRLALSSLVDDAQGSLIESEAFEAFLCGRARARARARELVLLLLLLLFPCFWFWLFGSR